MMQDSDTKWLTENQVLCILMQSSSVSIHLSWLRSNSMSVSGRGGSCGMYTDLCFARQCQLREFETSSFLPTTQQQSCSISYRKTPSLCGTR